VTRQLAGQLSIHRLIFSRGERCVSSPKCPNQLWGAPSLLVSGFWGIFPGG